MATEKFFAPKHDKGKHPSMHCHRTRFEAAVAEQKREPELCFPNEIGGHFQDVIKVPSGVIFEQPEVIEMERQNHDNRTTTSK